MRTILTDKLVMDYCKRQGYGKKDKMQLSNSLYNAVFEPSVNSNQLYYDITKHAQHDNSGPVVKNEMAGIQPNRRGVALGVPFEGLTVGQPVTETVGVPLDEARGHFGQLPTRETNPQNTYYSYHNWDEGTVRDRTRRRNAGVPRPRLIDEMD